MLSMVTGNSCYSRTSINRHSLIRQSLLIVKGKINKLKKKVIFCNNTVLYYFLSNTNIFIFFFHCKCYNLYDHSFIHHKIWFFKDLLHKMVIIPHNGHYYITLVILKTTFLSVYSIIRHHPGPDSDS